MAVSAALPDGRAVAETHLRLEKPNYSPSGPYTEQGLPLPGVTVRLRQVLPGLLGRTGSRPTGGEAPPAHPGPAFQRPSLWLAAGQPSGGECDGASPWLHCLLSPGSGRASLWRAAYLEGVDQGTAEPAGRSGWPRARPLPSTRHSRAGIQGCRAHVTLRKGETEAQGATGSPRGTRGPGRTPCLGSPAWKAPILPPEACRGGRCQAGCSVD